MSSMVVQTATTRIKDFGLGLSCVEGVHVSYHFLYSDSIFASKALENWQEL